MNFEISTTAEFERQAKILNKRHRSFKNDLKNFVLALQENPFQGVELSPGIRKIRMAITSKGRGKSGGARVQSDFSTVELSVIKEFVNRLD